MRGEPLAVASLSVFSVPTSAPAAWRCLQAMPRSIPLRVIRKTLARSSLIVFTMPTNRANLAHEQGILHLEYAPWESTAHGKYAQAGIYGA